MIAIISIACSLRAIEYWLIPFQIFILIMGIFYLVYLIQAVLQKVDGSLLFISGFFFILLGAVNDVLKNNDLIDSPPASHIALFGFILFQSILLAKIFSKDFNQLELAEGHIRQLNSNLEQKILDRTHTIRMILDHVQSGFLLINRQLKIETGYTRSCEEILGKKLEVDQKFSDIFSFSDRQRRSFELTINQVFDDILPEDITFAQIKSRLPIKNRQVLLQWAIIRDERNEIKSLLVTVTDSTHAALMEKEAKIGQSLIKILQSKLNFKSLLNEIFNDLNRAKSSDLHIEAAQKSLKMILHTIKGNLSSFGLDDIIHFIEELEDSSFITMIDIESLTFIIHQFLDSYKDILKIEATSLDAKSYQLHERQLLVLNESLKAKGASAEILDTFSDWLDDIRQVSFDDLIGPICKKAQLIGESIGKNVKMTIEGGHISIEPDRYQALVHNLIHLVRNSIDHGLEFPEERGKKPEFGQITMKISRTENAFCIDTCDDGRGIDPEHLKDTALKKGLVSIDDAKIMPASEALSLIFRNGFSTRSEVTSLSGRGIGMSAIESAVIELGGNISIQTQIGIGTIVHIEIPENIDLRNRLKSA